MNGNGCRIAVILGGLALLLSVIAAHAEKRVALVIGNATYKSTPALANPGNDAEDMAATLRQVGFTVVLEQNLDKRGMEQAIAQFGRDAQDADAALFYYAGHGLQYRGLNYLMPVDAKLEDKFSLNSEMTRVDDVLSSLDQARGVKILVLDACRGNPLADRLAGLASARDFVPNRGLARLDATGGMVVAYATQPNQIAADGAGRNSPFTAALVSEINSPGLEIGTMFRRVAIEVNKKTAGRQTPEVSFSLLGEFYFSRLDSDVESWAKLRGSQNPGQFKEFLNRYPSSPLAADIRERLDAIERVDRERLDRERAQAAEKAEQEKRAREQTERIRRDQAERDRVDREKEDHDRLAREQAEREKTEREQLAAKPERPQEEAVPSPSPLPQIAMLTPPPQIPANPVPTLSGERLVQEIKKELKRAGCYAGPIDGKWATPGTKSSVQKFMKYANIPAQTSDPSINFLDAIRENSDRVCPLECDARQAEEDGRCIAKVCQSGQHLNAQGNCVGKTTAMLHPENQARPAQSTDAAHLPKGEATPTNVSSPNLPKSVPGGTPRQDIVAGGQQICGHNGCRFVPQGCVALRHLRSLPDDRGIWHKNFC
jgi:hypothetical protein